MEYRLGRLFDHVHLRVADLDASKRFYVAVLGALGRELVTQDQDHFSSDELYVTEAGEEEPSHVHLAFQAADEDAVARFHRAGLAASGRDHGGPGARAYHPGYYSAYLLDPDGNNIEAVLHGPARRSAEAVIVTPEVPA